MNALTPTQQEQNTLPFLDRINTSFWGLCVFVIFLTINLSNTPIANAATPPETLITNTVTASFSLSGTQTQVAASAGITTEARTPSIISFHRITAQGNPVALPTASYDRSTTGSPSFQTIDQVSLPTGESIDLPNNYPIEETSQFIANEPIVIQVIDHDQNLDPMVAETVIVIITIPETGDEERILLTETSPSSGIFRGVIDTSQDQSSSFDGKIGVRQGARISVNYRDSVDNTDIGVTAALIDTRTSITFTKKADKTTASLGDSIKYTLNISTDGLTEDLTHLKIKDTLPPGFRYITGSTVLNDTPLNNDSITVNGRQLTFQLGTMPTALNWEISYRVIITAGAPIGNAVNQAQAISDTGESPIARAIVTLRDELMRDTAILTGRVFLGCEKDAKPTIIPGIRILLENGRTTASDQAGFWHMEGVRPGTHVVALDADSIPKGLSPILCFPKAKFAGKADSQFVDIKRGSLWRADFHLEGTPEKSISKENNENANHQAEQEDTTNIEEENPITKYNDDYAEIAKPGFKILWPKDNYVPDVASISIAIQHSPQQTLEVALNGKKLNPLNYDGSSSNKNKTVKISRWRGVDINIIERNNKLHVKLKDKSGKIIEEKTNLIHFSGVPTYVKFLEDQSTLIADGISEPTIVVQIKDQEGFPMRLNTHGYFAIESGNHEIHSKDSENLSLNGESINGQHKYLIGKDGITKIKLKPSTHTGEIRLRFHLKDNKTQEVRAWLKPHIRDKWVLVGLAEGTIGHNTIKGNLQTTNDLGKESDFYTDGRIAFFAKGKIKGKYLLTVAYDSAKQKTETGAQLDGNIDPDAWYTVYGDHSNSSYQTASSNKLYLKLEKDQFYALFGDYRSNMTVTELSRYERTLNGIHTEYKGRNLRYNVSLSHTRQKHQRDEIPGDGTSGEYFLSFAPIPNSEVITLETRDRFHPEQIISQRLLAQNADYNIDYDRHSLFFKFPISGRDENLNPNFIVIDYETDSSDKKTLTFAGRTAYLSDDGKIETGISLVHEDKNDTAGGDLIGADIRYKLDAQTTLKAEFAHTQTQTKGNAWLIEAERESAELRGRAYIRQQDTSFGLGHQNISEQGTRKAGIEADMKIAERLRLKGDIYRQQNLDNDNRRDQASIELEKQFKKGNISVGLRHTQELTQTETRKGNLLTIGGNVASFDGRINLRSHIEKNLDRSDDKNNNEAYPDRLIIGADVRLSDTISLFIEREITRSDNTDTNTDRIGLSTKLWEGASAKSSINHEQGLDSERVFATFGLAQHLKLNENLSADFSVDHTNTLKETAQESVDSSQPAINGAIRDDYTAISVGLGWNDKDLSWTSRLEHRIGDNQDKTNLRLGILRELGEGRDVSGHLQITRSKLESGEENNRAEISFGSAWHPLGSNYTVLQRLNFIDEENISTTSTSDNKHGKKVIHNIHINKQAGKKTQISLHHGIKHTLEDEFNHAFNNTVDTGLLQIRRDMGDRMDIGVHAGYLHDWETDNWEYNYGASIGATPSENIWLSAGYNIDGFSDDDFDQSEYTAKGPYLQFRYKADKDQLEKIIHQRKKK